MRGIAVDDVAAVPVRRRVYLNRQIPGRVDLNRLAAEREVRRIVCGVIEPDALKPGEGRELVDAEGAAADQRQNIRPRAARQAVTRVQRRRRRVHRIIFRTTHNGIRTHRQRESCQRISLQSKMKNSKVAPVDRSVSERSRSLQTEWRSAHPSREVNRYSHW